MSGFQDFTVFFMTSVGKIDDVSTKNDVRVRNILFPKVKTLFYVNFFISCHFAHFYDFYIPRAAAGTLCPPQYQSAPRSSIWIVSYIKYVCRMFDKGVRRGNDMGWEL